MARGIPIADRAAETVACIFIGYLISHFGTFSTVAIDHGHQFKSALWEKLMKKIGPKRTAYHPTANGIVKHFYYQLSYIQTQTQPDALPTVLLGIRTALKEDV